MALGINVETIINLKMGSYLDTLSPDDRQKKLEEYKKAAQDTLQGSIEEAENLITSIQSTCKEITTQVPLTITQIASLVTMVDPTAKAAQLTTIVQSVGSQKDQVNRASAQLSTLKNILSQLSVSSTIVDTLTDSIETVKGLLNTIPV